MSSNGRKRRRPLYGSTGLAIGQAAIETVRLAVGGLSNREIASRRGCSVHTVNNQLKLFYDVAQQTIDDDAFWGKQANPSLRRAALPLIWERMAPHIAHLIGNGDSVLAATPLYQSPAAAELPAARCRTLWGRAEVIDEVCHTMRDISSARIVLLAAFGGYGKTESARAAASRLLAETRFSRLVWLDLNTGNGSFYPDDETSSPVSFTSVARTILSRLGCASEQDLRRQLHTEATLVVIDGLESVDAGERRAVVDALHRWMGNGPSRALVTSRVDIVAPYLERPKFPGLDLPAAEAFLRDRNAHAPHATQLPEASPDVIERVWQLTRGMPLALHQVIGQTQHYELPRVIANLEAAYAHGSSDEFYVSLCQPAWRELSREARAMLVYMAVATRAPQTSAQLRDVELAGMTFDETALGNALAELTTWFLVQRALPLASDEEPTYTVHPTTRGYIQSPAMREQWSLELGIDDGVPIDTATRLHETLIALTIGAPGGEVGRSMTQFEPTVLDRTLARSIPDMLHAVRAHLQRGNDARVLWYWETITGYLWYFGRYQEFTECDEHALVAARRQAVSDPATGARLIGIISAELGYAAMELDEPERAARYFDDAADVFEALSDIAETVRVLRYQATLSFRQGDHAAAERHCREALTRLDRVVWSERPNAADERSILRSPIHNLLGSIYLDLPRVEAARREIVLALRIARRISGDHRYWSLSPTVNLGLVHERSGRRSLARRYYEHCLTLTEDGSSPDTRAEALVRLAAIAIVQGDEELARRHAHDAAALYEAMGKHVAATRAHQTVDGDVHAHEARD